MRRKGYPKGKSFIFLLFIYLLIFGSLKFNPTISLEMSSSNVNPLNRASINPNYNNYLSTVPSDLLSIQSPLLVNKIQYINESFDERFSLINPLNNDSLTGTNIKIAILDSGMNDTSWISDGTILNRSSVVANSSVYDNIGHGSLVGSIISKIAPEADLFSIKVADESGTANRENVESGIRLALTFNVSIIHASLGSENIKAINSTLIAGLTDRNISLIVSAGNSGPFGSSITTPAIFNEAIAVGMTYNETYIPFSSSMGPRPTGTQGPDIIAPGVYIPSYVNGNEAQNVSGTSFAAPFVTGSVALLRQAYPNYSPATIKGAILASANFLNNTSPTQQGSGLLDVSKAYETIGNLNNSPLLTFTPKKISSDFSYFGQAINGQEQTYNLGLHSSETFILERMNISNLLPIQAEIRGNTSDNLSIPINLGYNLIQLSLLIPKTLPMEEWVGNITFYFTHDNDSFERIFPINIENRYPGGRILFFQGYDNDSFIPDGPTGTFSQLHLYLENLYGMQVTGAVRQDTGLSVTGPLQETISSEGHITAEDLEKFDILVLADIKIGLTTEDIEVIHEWVDEGHSLLVLSYPSLIYGQSEILSNQTAINALLEPYDLLIENDISKPQMNRFSQASLVDSSPIDSINDLTFDYNGTSIKVTTGGHAGILAKATNVLDDTQENSVAGFWKDPEKNGKVVVFGSLDPFTDMSYSSRTDENFYIAAQTFRWLITDQEIPMDLILASNPDVGASTRIQITFPDIEPSGAFNGTIIEANGSYTQITFKYSINTFIGTWKPKKLGDAILWLNLQIGDSIPSNGLFILTVYDPATQDLFFIFLLGSFVVFAIAYYLISSRRNKPRLSLQEQLSMRYRKPNAQVGTKTIEPREICSQCRTPRHNSTSKYCFKCGKEL